MSICDDTFDPSCETCYEVSRADNDLVFIYGLTALTQYYLFVIDKFNNVYKVLFTSGADGSFTIDSTNSAYPSGLFNIYAGAFEVFIASDVDGTTVIPLTIYATNYNCLSLTISANTEIDCAETPRDSCEPAYITDSDGSTIFEVASGDAGTCTPTAPAQVHNSNDSYDTTVGCGDELELPDIEFTDSDGSTESVPSMEDIIATPCAATTFNMVVNQNGTEIYNETWDATDTNIINLT